MLRTCHPCSHFGLTPTSKPRFAGPSPLEIMLGFLQQQRPVPVVALYICNSSTKNNTEFRQRTPVSGTFGQGTTGAQSSIVRSCNSSVCGCLPAVTGSISGQLRNNAWGQTRSFFSASSDWNSRPHSGQHGLLDLLYVETQI